MSSRRFLLLFCAAPALALAGCGGGTSTVSVSDTAQPPASSVAGASSTATDSTKVAQASSSASASSSSVGGASASSTPTQASVTTSASTRTATAPAFASTTNAASGVASALAVLQSRGYSALDPTQYQPANTLQVLVGRGAGGQLAFFFIDGRYLGTDTRLPSAAISVVSANDTEVTLAYALTRPDGSSAGTANVTYALNNGMLSPEGPIPSASPTASPSRR